MSVKIEILDYKYSSGDNLTNVNKASSGLSSGWTAVNNTNAAWAGGGSGLTFLTNISSQSLVIGRTYNLSFKIYGYTGIGDIGFNTSSGVPISARFASNTNGVQHFTFIATSTSFPDLFGRSTNTGNISNISITDASVIDWDNSIVGELDITDHSDFPIAMTFQISDFKDLTSTSGDYSKTFKIPATKNNNNILKHLYIPNLSVGNKITDTKSCRILFNGLNSLTGLIQVDGVGGYGETPAYYNCVFFGSNLSWANKLQDNFMNEIVWGSNGENLEYNKPNIIATWQHEDSNNSANSPIVYPITSYGEYNALGDERTIQLLDTALDAGVIGGGAGYFGFNNNADSFRRSYGTPEPVADWRPSVFVKTTLDKIFSNIGYRISSAFMNTDMFKKLVWLLPNFQYNNPDERAIQYGYGNHFTGEGLIGSFLINPTNLPHAYNDWSEFEFEINLNNASDFALNNNTDNIGWDSINGYFTVQEYGYYTTKLIDFGLFVNRTAYTGGDLSVDYAKIELQLQTVGQSSWNTIASMSTSTFFDSGISTPIESEPAASQDFQTNINNYHYLNKGDKLKLILNVKARTSAVSGNQITLNLFGSSSPTSTTQSSNANARYNIDLTSVPVSYGQTYNLKDVINSEYRQLDFIKGIAHAFNLQMTTDESNRTINIEPFDNFYKPLDDAIDWTYKLDRSNETSDKWLESELKRTLVFKYKSDSNDAKVKARGVQYFKGIEDEYPYREILPDTFKKGDSTFENPFFAGTYNAKDNDTTGIPNVDTAYSACLWTEDVSSNDAGRPDKGFDFLPRLLYWNKYSPVGQSSGVTDKSAVVQTWSATTKTITADATTNCPSCNLSVIYPQATMINRDSTTSPNLAYGNAWIRNYDDATGIYSSTQSGKGLYATYYKDMIEMLMNNPRLRTVYIDLKITDIVNLDFTKLVYIDGVYWRLNRVVDYMPSQRKSTKVELIEWFDLGSFAPTAPFFGHSGSDFLNSGDLWNEGFTVG